MATDDRQLRRDFERMLAAAVGAREEEAQRRVAAAQQAAAAAQAAAQRAEARAEAAEVAKIDLTLALAAAARAAGCSTWRAAAPTLCGSSGRRGTGNPTGSSL
jgi:hypothetical protein